MYFGFDIISLSAFLIIIIACIGLIISGCQIFNWYQDNNKVNKQVELIEDKSEVDTALKIRQNDFIIRDGVVEVTIGIEFCISEQKTKVLNMIEEVSMEESKDLNTYSMVIYFVKPGDTLWKIAKSFKSTVEDIAKINDIQDVNKINVGQQLYIPRFCKNKIAVQ